MTLSNILSALASNTGLNITLVNTSGDSMITFNAAGYESIESDLGARTVNSIKIVSSTNISIVIGDAA